MKFEEVPVGFGLALVRNEEATNAFAMMTREQKQEIWSRARRARSKEEMNQVVNSILSQQTCV
ncbi:MAG: hypothetical protein E7449_02055 [Ruminococcaceae bacterium]|nr:hypothetical protein [Oscillospiraceae bacterium]